MCCLKTKHQEQICCAEWCVCLNVVKKTFTMTQEAVHHVSDDLTQTIDKDS